MFNQVGGNGTMNMNGILAPPSEDRYAALKDLDSLMKQSQMKEETTSTLSASTWNANNSNGEYYLQCYLVTKCRLITRFISSDIKGSIGIYKVLNCSTECYVEYRSK